MLACSARTTSAAVPAPADAPLLLLTTAPAPSSTQPAPPAPDPSTTAHRPAPPARPPGARVLRILATFARRCVQRKRCCSAAPSGPRPPAPPRRRRWSCDSRSPRPPRASRLLARITAPHCPLPAARRPWSASEPAALRSFPFGARLSWSSLVRRICNRPPHPLRLLVMNWELQPGCPISIQVCRPPELLPSWRAGCDIAGAKPHHHCCESPRLITPLPALWRWQAHDGGPRSDRGCRREAAPQQPASRAPRNNASPTRCTARPLDVPPGQRFGSGGISSADLQHTRLSRENLGDAPGTGVVCEMAVTLTHFTGAIRS